MSHGIQLRRRRDGLAATAQLMPKSMPPGVVLPTGRRKRWQSAIKVFASRRFGTSLKIVASKQIAGLDPKHPDGEDCDDHGKSADGPSGDIGRATAIGLVDHRVVPLVVHMSLLKSSASRQLSAGAG